MTCKHILTFLLKSVPYIFFFNFLAWKNYCNWDGFLAWINIAILFFFFPSTVDTTPPFKVFSKASHFLSLAFCFRFMLPINHNLLADFTTGVTGTTTMDGHIRDQSSQMILTEINWSWYKESFYKSNFNDKNIVNVRCNRLIEKYLQFYKELSSIFNLIIMHNLNNICWSVISLLS